MSLLTRKRIVEPLDADCVLYLPFWEGAGTKAEDLSPLKNYGTLINTASWVDGVLGKAVQSSDSISAFIQVTGNRISLTLPFSILWWMNMTAHQTTNSNNRFFTFSVGNLIIDDNTHGSTYQIRVPCGNGGCDYKGTSQIFNINQWYHFGVVFTDSLHFSVYADGSFVQTLTKTLYPLYSSYSNMNLTLGGNGGATTTETAIMIDELRIFNNRALSATEIFEDYYRGARGNY